MSPKVTVISLSYNHAQFIGQCVESVLTQKTDFDFNFIVSDDCSSDNTPSTLQLLAAKYPGRIQLILRDKNVGGARNFLDTYAMATGEFIAIVEGDDYWTDKRKLQKQVDALEANRDCSLCFHLTTYVDESGKPTGWIHPEHFKPHWTLADVVAENPVQTCSIMLRRECVPKLPSFFLDLKLGDWPLCILAARKGGLICLPDPMAAYRVHANGVWSGLALSKKNVATSAMYLRLAAEYPDLIPLIETAMASQIEKLTLASLEVHALRKTRTWKIGSAIVRPALWLKELALLLRKP